MKGKKTFKFGLVVGLFCFVLYGQVKGQKYELTSGKVTFFSEAPMENITAENTAIKGLFNATGETAFLVPINRFQFEKDLMKEHFNEKYMESGKYPNGTFKGIFSGFDLKKPGIQRVKASGVLTLHNVSQKVEVPGEVQIKGDQLIMDATFTVRLKDYKIKIPQLLWQNIAEEVEVTVHFEFKKIK